MGEKGLAQNIEEREARIASLFGHSKGTQDLFTKSFYSGEGD